MWGVGCVMTGLIIGGVFQNLYLADYYYFHYINEYIPFFTFASLVAFVIAHRFFGNNEVNVEFNIDFLCAILKKYKWIMWLNFIGGILRMVLMVNLVGFDNVMDYRVAANTMMNTGLGSVGLVFRITSYIQLLANFYIALCGFKTGFETIELKKVITLFILYSPTQMATGGRLFILYFILFYIGSFLLGRGLSISINGRMLLEKTEKKVLSLLSIGLLSLIPILVMVRQSDINNDTSTHESAISKYTYISEGMLESEHYMRFNPPEKIQPDYGQHFITGHSRSYLNYRKYLQMTYMSSIVISVITPLYTSFGFWGSIVVWGIVAFCIEVLAINCLKRLSIIRFFVFVTLLKIMYESVISNPLPGNLPVYELIILLAMFYKPIFGQLDYEQYETHNGC